MECVSPLRQKVFRGYHLPLPFEPLIRFNPMVLVSIFVEFFLSRVRDRSASTSLICALFASFRIRLVTFWFRRFFCESSFLLWPLFIILSCFFLFYPRKKFHSLYYVTLTVVNAHFHAHLRIDTNVVGKILSE